MKQGFIRSAGRFLIAGLFAFVLLTLFCMVYSNSPVHYPDPDGATDYRWQPNAFRSQATEGFSYGKTNNEGYFNIRNHQAGEPVDVLIMGSSQMEASNVMLKDSTSALLEAKLTDQTVYNIGTSGHYLPTCADNLDKALQKYRPSSFVVIQTSTLSFSDKELTQAIEGTVPEIPSNNGGIVGMLQRNQFLRRLYHQAQNYLGKAEDEDDLAQNESVDEERPSDRELLSQLLAEMASSVSDYDAKLILLYHPRLTVNSDGSLALKSMPSEVQLYEELCAENGIYFLDMSGRFVQEYEENYTLPYGFANTSVGSGHLNKYGHAMIADELYKLIVEVV